MVDVLIEMHLLNARLRVTNQPLEGARDSILARYDIDSTTYARALTYYAAHTDEYSDVYRQVVDALADERGPVVAPDSIPEQPGLIPPSP
jgi:hypothetical protein